MYTQLQKFTCKRFGRFRKTEERVWRERKWIRANHSHKRYGGTLYLDKPFSCIICVEVAFKLKTLLLLSVDHSQLKFKRAVNLCRQLLAFCSFLSFSSSPSLLLFLFFFCLLILVLCFPLTLSLASSFGDSKRIGAYRCL